MEDNKIFQKLRDRLKKFTIEADEAVQKGMTKLIPEYDYQVTLHNNLRKVLRGVVLSAGKERQEEYLLRIYKWYFGKLSGCGAMSTDDKEEEEKFINPKKFEKIKALKDEELEKQKKLLEDEDNQKEETMRLFYTNERTEHKEIPPARDRITDFQRKPVPQDKRP